MQPEPGVEPREALLAHNALHHLVRGLGHASGDESQVLFGEHVELGEELCELERAREERGGAACEEPCGHGVRQVVEGGEQGRLGRSEEVELLQVRLGLGEDRHGERPGQGGREQRCGDAPVEPAGALVLEGGAQAVQRAPVVVCLHPGLDGVEREPDGGGEEGRRVRQDGDAVRQQWRGQHVQRVLRCQLAHLGPVVSHGGWWSLRCEI